MSRKTRTKSKTRNNAKSRAKKATVSTVKSTDTEETVIPTAEPAIIKEEVAQPEPKEEIKIETPVEENQVRYPWHLNVDFQHHTVESLLLESSRIQYNT